MGLIKKNIWLLFYMILFISSTLFGTISYLKWKDIYKSYQVENENIVRLISNSTLTYFTQIEMLLKILGEQLSKEKRYSDAVVSKKIFKELIKINPSIAGFALSKPNGDFFMFHGDMNQIKMLPNLLDKEVSKQSFQKSLENKHMVLGRTYFFKPLNTLVIPARKAIRDTEGNVVAVMILGINVQKAKFLNKEMLFSDENVIQLLRDSDMYRQLFISKKLDDNDASNYKKPIQTKYYENLKELLLKENSTKESQLKTSGDIISYINIPHFELSKESDKKYLNSLKYIKKYDLWVISQIPYSTIVNEFFLTFYLFLVIFVAICFVLYKMFRYIANFENSKKESLRFQATHDPLTHLPNRQFLLNDTAVWFKKNTKFSILFVDLDNFKYTNDSFGHDIGDLVLKQVAFRLKSLIADNDLVIRHGGDEFIIFSTRTRQNALEEYSKRIIDKLSEPYFVRDLTVLLGASIGISSFPEDSTNLHELISCSDVALYEAKKHKNDFCIYKKSLKKTLLNKIEIENQMKVALLDNEFYMSYQPQINSDGTLYGVEALARWHNKKLGFVGPDKFIPIAENNGFIAPLGNFILDTVFSELHTIQKNTGLDIQVSINISLRQFMENSFYENVLEKIANTGLNPKKVTLEITESLYIHDMDYIIELINKFKKSGIKISMDDFGTGYSSLSILNKLPIDELKIDKYFIDDMIKDTSSLQMIQSIINIGESFGFHLLAEGVESKEQVELLEKLQCTTYQGYYFSKPLKKEELEAYIKTNFKGKV